MARVSVERDFAGLRAVQGGLNLILLNRLLSGKKPF